VTFGPKLLPLELELSPEPTDEFTIYTVKESKAECQKKGGDKIADCTIEMVYLNKQKTINMETSHKSESSTLMLSIWSPTHRTKIQPSIALTIA
jgi:hypothetical protein